MLKRKGKSKHGRKHKIQLTAAENSKMANASLSDGDFRNRNINSLKGKGD